MFRQGPRVWRVTLSSALMFCFGGAANRWALADTNVPPAQWRQLEEQNRALREQLGRQAEVIKRLNERVSELERALYGAARWSQILAPTASRSWAPGNSASVCSGT